MLDAVIAPETRLDLDLDESIPAVTATPTSLRQLLMNLITNASEAYDGTAGTISLKTSQSADRVVLEVADRGRGMDLATRARMFEPFFTTRIDGRGLGLAIVHRIIKTLRGRIDVDTEPGQGTTIRVELPRGEGRSRTSRASAQRRVIGAPKPPSWSSTTRR